MSNSILLTDKLAALSKYSGWIVFSIDNYYVQFAKDTDQDYIMFEAVSHNFIDIPQNLQPEFVRLGFSIDKENYYKKININEIDNIATDVKIIFDKIYLVDFNEPFTISDEIDY